MATGTLVKRTAEERFDRLMQWSVLLGFGLVFGGQYFSNIPYSVYPSSNFWTNSPALILIRFGIMPADHGGSVPVDTNTALAGLELDAGDGQEFADGVLGSRHDGVRRADTSRSSGSSIDHRHVALAAGIVTAMMVAISALWLSWKARAAREAGAERVAA